MTHREYLAFLNDLLAREQIEPAQRLAPRGRSGTVDEQGPLLYSREKVLEHRALTIQLSPE